MEKSIELLKRAEKDLCINVPFYPGQNLGVKNCWHFYTDGSAVDSLFHDELDFLRGMNRIYVVLQNYDVIILAFVLMDTHVHFVLYGSFEECNDFIHEYIRRTSMYISERYNERKKLRNLPISHQSVGDQNYLKTLICYVLRNPIIGGLHASFYDYQWSSGGLYFRSPSSWYSPTWLNEAETRKVGLGGRYERSLLLTHQTSNRNVGVSEKLVFPGEYVEIELVEKIFKTSKAFFFLMGASREMDVESRGGILSHLTIPIQELRQHKSELSKTMFNTEHSRSLDMTQRVRLAKELRRRYHCSSKQIARVCGLVYDEVKDILK